MPDPRPRSTTTRDISPSYKRPTPPPRKVPIPPQQSHPQNPTRLIIGLISAFVILVVGSGLLVSQALHQSQNTTIPSQSSTVETPVSTNTNNSTPSVGSTTYQTQGYVFCLAWSHDGNYLAIASGLNNPGDVEIWDTRTQQKVLTYTNNTKNVFLSVSWSPDDTELVSLDGDGIISVWKRNGQTLYSLRADANTVAWSPNGQYIAYSGNDDAIIDAASGKVVQQLEGIFFFSNISKITWSPDSSRLAGISASGSNIGVWTVSGGGTKLYQEAGSNPYMNALSWSNDGTKIAVGESNGNIKIIDSQSGQVIATTRTDAVEITALAWSNNGKIATGGRTEGYQSTVQISDGQGNKQHTFSGRGQPMVRAIAWSPNGNFVAVGTSDGLTQVFAIS